MAIDSKRKGKAGGARVITYTTLVDENTGEVWLIGYVFIDTLHICSNADCAYLNSSIYGQTQVQPLSYNPLSKSSAGIERHEDYAFDDFLDDLD